MKKILIALILIAFLMSCKKTEKKQAAITKEKKTVVAKKGSAIEMQSFADFPEEIDGPGCVFSFSQKEYKKGGKYIYSDDLDSICYIKIKDNFVRLRLVAIDTTWSPIMHYAKKFKNDDYQLSVDVKKIDEDDEVSLLKGVILIKYKDEPEQKKEVYGYCGC